MKIFLLGATGDTGYEVLKKLISENHKVKILVRTPSKLNTADIPNLQKDQIEVIQGSVMEAEKLIDLFKDCDAIVSALGTGKNNSYTEIYSKGGRNIIAAMRSNQIKRLITITSALIDMSDTSTDNFFLNRIIRPNFNKIYSDQTRWETILDDTTDINWTCVRPTYLVNQEFTGRYRIKNQHCPPKGRKIGRSDLADFIVKVLYSNEYIHQKPVLAY